MPLPPEAILKDLDTLAKTSDTGERWMGGVAMRAKTEIEKLRALLVRSKPFVETYKSGAATTDVLLDEIEAALTQSE